MPASGYPRTDQRYPGWVQFGPTQWTRGEIGKFGPLSGSPQLQDLLRLNANQHQIHLAPREDQVKRDPDFGFYVINEILIRVIRKMGKTLIQKFVRETRKWKE